MTQPPPRVPNAADRYSVVRLQSTNHKL